MAVNRLELDILTLHSSDDTKTLQIKVKGESLSISVTDEIGLPTSTEIQNVTAEQAETIALALSHWYHFGRLNYQNQEDLTQMEGYNG